jgi:hypothetical protein
MGHSEAMATTYSTASKLRAEGKVKSPSSLRRWKKYHNFPEGTMLPGGSYIYPDDKVDAWHEARRAAKRALSGCALASVKAKESRDKRSNQFDRETANKDVCVT